ncbi:hypothetical protein GOP47_0003102 [Adiantum capillus-veneris]|uniref:DUF4371 domain-containing protein n=1 Tax=Adiantum capillus-veneris TaxID=13818 RepID=A0A9D4VC47_ADICA|nr:hypothetical protein GOP47_0003102 [Adiantum capillus-veneris]
MVEAEAEEASQDSGELLQCSVTADSRSAMDRKSNQRSLVQYGTLTKIASKKARIDEKAGKKSSTIVIDVDKESNKKKVRRKLWQDKWLDQFKPWLVYDDQKDLDVKSMTSLYNDDKACYEMLQCIANSIMHESLEKVRESPWFGVVVDESMDISIHHHLVMYLSYLEDGSMPCNAFMALFAPMIAPQRGFLIPSCLN